MIKYFVKKDMKENKIHADFQNTLGDSAPSYSTVTRWANGFKCGRESLEDDPHTGWPRCVMTPDMIAKVHKMVFGGSPTENTRI